MKKITIVLMMLLSASAFAQIEIVDNFDSESNGSAPSNWTGNYLASSSFICDGDGLSAYTALPAGVMGDLVSQNYTAISNGTDLTASFSYNIFEQVSQFPPPQFSAPATDWGSLVLEYSTDGGTTWTNITTIDDSNYAFTDLTTCQSVSVDVGTIADGSDFQARFVSNIVNVDGFRAIVMVDNISLTQVANDVPNCDTTLLSPVNGADDADTDLTLSWQAATGLATGYTVYVGTTSGGTDIVDGETTSETNYAISGLTFDTPYYVTIVPFNNEGDAIGCTEESFTTRSAPSPGATCGSPIEVASFPFIDSSGNTANFENNIDSSPCNNTYMNGNDVFYEITPTSDVSVNIEVNSILPASSNRAAVHVVQDCPDVATECIAYDGSFSGDSRSLLDVVLLSGNTYFVVMSSSNASNTFEYDLIITENSCINPTLDTLTPVADCDSAEFSVDVDVSYLGSATSLTLSDDFAGTTDITNITSTGVVTAGPYPSGTTVNFILTNDDDGTCSYMDSAYFYCPPTNDECANAIDLTSTINTDDLCTNVTAATNAGATESVADSNTCASSFDNTNDVWFSFMASSETMILEYLNITAAIGSGGTIQATELLEGNCGTLTSIDCWTTNYVTLAGLTIGNTYYFRNNTRLSGEYAQNYEICLSEAPDAPSNDECSAAAAMAVPTAEAETELVSGTTVGATLSTDNSCETSGFGDVWYVLNPTVTGVYEFSIEENPTGQDGSVSYSIYEGSCGALTAKTSDCTSSNSVVTLDMGTTYYAMVQSSQSNPGLTFDLDITKLPDGVANSDCSSPIVFSESSDLNGDNKITGNINITDVAYYSPQGACNDAFASVWYEFTPTLTGTYNFELSNGVDDVGTPYYTVYDSNDCSTIDFLGGDINSCFESGTDSGPVEAGTTYLVSIQSNSPSDFEFFVYPDPSLSIDSNNFEDFKYYPNPVKNTLTVEARNSISQISIHNIVGQKVKEMVPNNLTTSIDMNELKTGVYFVTVMINSSQKTFRVIKE